jgi:hypothetical protein
MVLDLDDFVKLKFSMKEQEKSNIIGARYQVPGTGCNLPAGRQGYRVQGKVYRLFGVI